jgi:hypothetical protein
MSKKKSNHTLLIPEAGAGPERFPALLFSQPEGARQAHFEHCLIEHTFLAEACTAVQHAICMPGEDAIYRRKASMVLVIGPSRVGKTTLIHLLEEDLLLRAKPRMQEDPGYIPFVSITSDGSGRGRFEWKDDYLSILRQLRDPFLQMKKPATSTRDLCEATEEALTHRKTEVIIVDEAHHLAKAAWSGRRLQDHLDHLKYFENKMGVSHVLVGTYEMRPFRTVNAQLACRSVDVHFPRYDATQETERAIFKSVLWALQRQLPLPKEPDLLHHWEFLYARSLGCVGLLKQHLNQALKLALSEQADTVTASHLRRTALHKEKVDLALEAILDGEKDFCEPEDADLCLLVKLGMRQPSPSESLVKTGPPPHPDGSAKSGERAPGERAPGRDPVGMREMEQEGNQHEESRVAG